MFAWLLVLVNKGVNCWSKEANHLMLAWHWATNLILEERCQLCGQHAQQLKQSSQLAMQ